MLSRVDKKNKQRRTRKMPKLTDEEWEQTKRKKFLDRVKAWMPPKYFKVIRTAIDNLEPDADTCRVFCHPVGMVAKEICNDLGMSDAAFEFCVKVIRQMKQEGWFVELLGSDRLIVAGSLVYIAGYFTGEHQTQKQIARIINCWDTSIATCYKKIVKLGNLQAPNGFHFNSSI